MSYRAALENVKKILIELFLLFTYLAKNLRFIRYNHKERRFVINKVCFAINSPILFPHYESIFQNLKEIDFDIIYGKFSKYSEFEEVIRYCRKNNYKALNSFCLLRMRIKYKTLITHQCGSIVKPKNLKKLSLNRVRMIYGLGKNNWMFYKENCDFDYHLLYGNFAKRKTLENFAFPENIFKVGYPRFDIAFKMSEDDMKSRLGIEKDCILISWLPTHGYNTSSINSYIEILKKINGLFINKKKIKIIAKTHFLETKKNIEMIKVSNIDLIEDSTFNNAIMMKISDFVFCDYGGSMFGAILLEKNLVLLNNKEVLIGDNKKSLKYFSTTEGDVKSADIEIRDAVTNIDSDIDRDSLITLLGNKAKWQAQLKGLKEYRDDFFEPYYGYSGEVAATCIKGIHLDKTEEIDRNIEKIIQKYNPQK